MILDNLRAVVSVNIVGFGIACYLGGVDNMVACLIINLITNSIANIENWVEYIF